MWAFLANLGVTGHHALFFGFLQYLLWWRLTYVLHDEDLPDSPPTPYPYPRDATTIPSIPKPNEGKKIGRKRRTKLGAYRNGREIVKVITAPPTDYHP